ncbi:restriction endonuclease subunit S [Natroniella sp. ANB-PHB2]|uniref:restriction endonuclease subunit S n=1 Tax=Natroniella sp. ANB-PHB2 TaxID=3384444 RepID=UPI0038D514EA
MEHKRYDEYKDSGIEYLNKIPVNWNLKRFKYLFSHQKGKKPNKTNPEQGIPYLSMDYLRDKDIENVSYVNNTIGLVKANENEILILWDGSNSGEILKSPCGIISSTMAKIECLTTIINKDYGYFLLKYLERYIKDNTIGMGIPHVDSKILNNIKLTLPPFKEQQKIASFLDKKTAEIGGIIKQKEALVDKLEEYKKSVITEAVTKAKIGDKYLNQAGELVDEIKMKDSGVEWIGEIPEYFKKAKLKYIAHIELGKMLQNNKKPNYFYKPYLKAKNILWNKLDLSEIEKMWFSKAEMKKYQLSKNDMLVCEGGEVGRSAIWNEEIEECFIQNSVHKISFFKNEISKYYLYYFMFLGEKKYFDSIVNQVSIAHLTKEKLINISIVKPSFQIQNKIIDYLDQKTTQINNLIQKTKESIEKYKTYKKSLIYEAVTGKIDLRDYEGGE